MLSQTKIFLSQNRNIHGAAEKTPEMIETVKFTLQIEDEYDVEMEEVVKRALRSHRNHQEIRGNP